MSRDSTIEIRDDVDLINQYVFHDENGQPEEARNVNFDFGNPAPNKMYSLIKRDLSTSTDRTDQKFAETDEKFNEMGERFKGMERLIVMEGNRSKNTLLAPGGDMGSPNAYLPICNDRGEHTSDDGLEPLSSTKLIE